MRARANAALEQGSRVRRGTKRNWIAGGSMGLYGAEIFGKLRPMRDSFSASVLIAVSCSIIIPC